MSFDPQRERFYLTDYDTAAIPRLPVELTADDYLQIYQHLLNKSSKKKNQSTTTPASNPNNDAQKNPLLLDRRDFTKPQTADFHQTPRSLLPKTGENHKIADDEQSQYASVMLKM
ncbi:hypothetical protein BLA29_005998 [Euroglyphus maynei]|uniref:Uncharacterized protein n=1 Tax=Euroglyphus maynei TaxID=6958 RepID=A0A1Y3BJX0_EURMA|nr:hypothetical protein BLA29_005998 [Euroglyphus maynei]